MSPSESPAAWLELVDYDNYAKNFENDENRFTFPEIGDLNENSIPDPNSDKNPPSKPLSPCIEPSARGGLSEQPLTSAAKNADGTTVGEARQEGDEEKNERSAQGSGSAPAASIPLIIVHPRATTMRGRTAGWDSCDTCHRTKVSICPHNLLEKADTIQRRCDHGKDGFIDPVRAARPHKKRKLNA